MKKRDYSKVKNNLNTFRNIINILFTIILIFCAIVYKSFPFAIGAVVVGLLSYYLFKQNQIE